MSDQEQNKNNHTNEELKNNQNNKQDKDDDYIDQVKIKNTEMINSSNQKNQFSQSINEDNLDHQFDSPLKFQDILQTDDDQDIITKPQNNENQKLNSSDQEEKQQHKSQLNKSSKSEQQQSFSNQKSQVVDQYIDLYPEDKSNLPYQNSNINLGQRSGIAHNSQDFLRSQVLYDKTPIKLRYSDAIQQLTQELQYSNQLSSQNHNKLKSIKVLLSFFMKKLEPSTKSRLTPYQKHVGMKEPGQTNYKNDKLLSSQEMDNFRNIFNM
ncbi:hypothetical protein PPERSA_04240 [Pseudocohnilembus persalinus]|uniref:Uncharacterized protein n=1 Tax=Pseudocohnilembus persalinus TaxID=266149 RepID=A0A0V0QND2_PSEPJ|nr:hypothetical protein PPERSA_04240 [Pseudocohnilembus persalinus]|eukprot:KRX03732.1 hypothetical protein PPERSA_04240 [Pseudocohnilembus persalinus]